MGFIPSANTITLTAKLTPIGRRKLVTNNNSLITTFSLGDSDANYATIPVLKTGEVPSSGGDIGTNTSFSNSTTSNISLKSMLIVSGNGVLQKLVEPTSSSIITEQALIGFNTVSGSNLSQVTINRNENITNSLVNLYYSFGLSLNPLNDIKYTATTYVNGGYANTALSGLAQTNIIVLGIDNSQYGEMLDGKSIKVVLPTSGGTYDIYSTYQNNVTSLEVQDSNYKEISQIGNAFGNNIAFLFSDSIMTPNGGAIGYSWATGYGIDKPFSLGNKSLFNLQTNSNIGATADTCVGVAYLDKGIIVITHPTIVNNYGNTPSIGATIEYNSVSTTVYQNVNCVANRGEFGGSTNQTFKSNNIPRISEVVLFDNTGDLIAIAKPDRHITKNINEFIALSINIQL